MLFQDHMHLSYGNFIIMISDIVYEILLMNHMIFLFAFDIIDIKIKNDGNMFENK